jgi:hypothetical protein
MDCTPARRDITLMSVASLCCWVALDVALAKSINVDNYFPEDSRVGLVLAAMSPAFYMAACLGIRQVYLLRALRRVRAREWQTLLILCLLCNAPALYLLRRPFSLFAFTLGGILIPYVAVPAVIAALFSSRKDLRWRSAIAAPMDQPE